MNCDGKEEREKGLELGKKMGLVSKYGEILFTHINLLLKHTFETYK